jgi:hypothetical protein
VYIDWVLVNLPTNTQSMYWIWDADYQTVMHSFVIPRLVSAVAGGKYLDSIDGEGRAITELAAKPGDPEWGIVQSPFMTKKASDPEGAAEFNAVT